MQISQNSLSCSALSNVKKRNLNSSYECVEIVVIIVLCVVSVPDKVLPCQLWDRCEMLPVISVTLWVWSKNLLIK